MKRETYLILAAMLLTLSGVLFAGEASDAEEPEPLKVRSIVKNQDARYSDKREPGPSDRMKARRSDGEQGSYLAPAIVHIPDQEVSDVK